MTKREVVYNASLAILAYSKQEQIKWNEYGLELVSWIENKKSDTQGFVATIDKAI